MFFKKFARKVFSKTFLVFLKSLSEKNSPKLFYSDFKKIFRKYFSKTFLFCFLKTFSFMNSFEKLCSKYFILSFVKVFLIIFRPFVFTTL
jgi:hypothetical protein